jgi:hypothetical protein
MFTRITHIALVLFALVAVAFAQDFRATIAGLVTARVAPQFPTL